MNKTLNISHLSSGGLITNYYCSSTCKHCLYRCSPHWPKTFISPTITRQNFQTALALGCTSMHIGGGEPLLNPDGVVSVLQTAREVDIPGLCAGLSIHTSDLGCELDPNQYPAITSLHSGGIGELLDYAANTFNIHPGKETYSSKCELCFEIRKHLALEKNMQSKELQPIEHYTLEAD
jgi:hypothetical protein